MKSIILLTIIACSYGAKLDRGYLPPEHAQSSSGAQFLETPISQPIVVADNAVFHQSSAEAHNTIQRPQLSKGFVQIGNQASSIAHGVEANAVAPQYLPPSKTYVQVGNQESLAHGVETKGVAPQYLRPNAYVQVGSQASLAHAVETKVIAPQYQPPSNFIQVGSHGSTFAHGVEVTTISAPHPQAINGLVQVGSHASSLAHGVQAVHYQGHDLEAELRPERPQAAKERNAAILRQDYQSDGKGYAYVYETENGLFGEENGVATHGVIAQGAFAYTGDDGVKYSITYTADENGFHPQGDHLPTPHPIPEAILKSIEQNARDEAAGIFDDGSYYAEKYGEHATYVAKDAHIEHQVQPVIINNHPAVHEEQVTNTVLVPETGIQRPIYRNPSLAQILVNVPEHVNNVNNGYLPPVHQQILAKRSSAKDKAVYGSKTRQPSSSSKKEEKN